MNFAQVGGFHMPR